jgi:hypothetical protein
MVLRLKGAYAFGMVQMGKKRLWSSVIPFSFILAGLGSLGQVFVMAELQQRQYIMVV